MSTVYIQFNGIFKEQEKLKIANYIQNSPYGFWGKRVSVYKENKTDFITIKDHQNEHRVFAHELKHLD